MSLDDDIRSRLEEIRARIDRAASMAGRQGQDIRLVAVSKTFGLDHIRAAFAAGQRDFGENRVQEALQKIGGSTDLLIRWHLIGTLQSNKARKAADVFEWIHSVDSLELLQRLDSAASQAGRQPNLLVQVDLAGEATKHGVPADRVPAIFQAARTCRAARVVGLMLLPPWSEDPDGSRPYFSQLRKLRDQLRVQGVPTEMLQELSMGMSHDFEAAVLEGATMVRIGTAIFGRRMSQ
ncbi:MAG TPA: YggS family pyridoxal phosphate-dependent enzyme [Vicinamibacterales bacterium]